MWCGAILQCASVAFAALLICIGGDDASNGVAAEVRAFVDADGTLHWGGRTFSRIQESSLTRSSRDSDVHICQAGEAVKAQYGGLEKIVKLPRSLPIGSATALSCTQEFGADGFAGHLLLRCGANASLEVEIQCGCAPGPAFRPEFGLKPISYSRSQQCLEPPPRSIDRGAPRVVWSSRNLDDGGSEIRDCSELLAGANGSWQIRCSQGRLCAEGSSCKPPGYDKPHWRKSDFDEEASQEQSQAYSNGTASPRRLSTVCNSPPRDNWWPTVVCGSLEAVPYSTVAGGYLPGSTQLQLNSPHGLFVSPFNNELYVCDWKNHRIQRWTQASTKVITVAGQTGLTGTFLDTEYLFNPADVMVAGRNKFIPCAEIFIADESNNRILRWPPYAPQGFMVVGYGEAREDLNHPTGLFVTPDYHVYIADRLNHRVIVWSQRPGRLQWQYNRTVAGLPKFGKTGAGTALRALDRPSDVAVSMGGSVRDAYIADFGNDRVVVWGVNDVQGTIVGECYGPYSVYVNDEGAVFGACKSIHCVKRWEKVQGTWMETGTTGTCGFFVTAPRIDDPSYPSTINTLFNPSSVFVDIYGNIFVSDTFNARVIKRGRDPLTQWIISNARTTSFSFTITDLRFFLDLACSQEPPVKHLISAEGVMPSNAPWTPECTQTGTGICEPNTAWIGRQFFGEKAIRCIKLTVDYDDTGGDTFEAAVRYWKGSEYKTLYRFGRLPTRVPQTLRYPAFSTISPFCVKGQRECSMNISGDWVTDGDKIMIKKNNCATGPPLYGFPNGGLSLPATKSGTYYQIGDESFPDVIQADASEGTGTAAINYHICWCDTRINLCQLHQDFTNYVNTLRVDGPFEGQTMINYRGTRLTFDGLKGVNLEPGDRMNVISGGCGISATDVLGVPRPGNSVIARSNPSNTGYDYTWGQDDSANYVTAKPGEYLMCWCRPTLSPCYTLVDYQATAGNLWINGPKRGHVYDCVKGDACNFLIEGFNLDRRDSIVILARCGFEPLTLGFPPIPGGGWFEGLTLTDSGGDNSTYGWDDAGVLPVAAIYFICWCSGASTTNQNCRIIDSYNTDVGTLTIYGPLEINIECALGDVCEIKGVQGLGLELSSRAMVIEKGGTCGSMWASPASGFPGQFPAISFPATELGTAYHWGTIGPNAIPPDIYPVCWCHTKYACSNVTDFKAPLGQVSVKGPDKWSSFKLCGTGKDCVVTISGLFLKPQDTMIMVKGSCSTGILALKNARVEDVRSRTDDGVLHIWASSKVPGSPGGKFVACWCAAGCTTVERYSVEVGELIISSPKSDNEVRCLSGSACSFTIQGFGLYVTDQIGILQNGCGTEDAVAGIPNNGVTNRTLSVAADMSSAVFLIEGSEFNPPQVVEAIGGNYTMCWCPSSPGIPSPCRIMSDFNIPAGWMLIGAPSAIHDYICYNGLPCKVSGLVGLGLSNGDQLRVTSTCQLQSNVAGFAQRGISSGATAAGTKFSWGEARLSVIVGAYRLCWCANANDCTRPHTFTTEFGTMIVGGPISGKMEVCDSGYECQLDNIEGFNLLKGDSVVLLLICGQGYPIYGWQRGGAWHAWPPFIAETPQPCPGALADEVCTTFKAEDPRMLAEPGDYRMCWCSFTSPTCNSAADFTVDVGLFVNVGAKSSQYFECAAGFVCTIREMAGRNLENGDRYKVVNTTSNCTMGQFVVGVPNQGVSNEAYNDGSEITWLSAFSTTIYPSNNYTLCWCSKSLSCNQPENFAMKGGTIAVVGPYADQNRECVLGKVCMVYNIKGVQLKNQDLIRVVVGSCGPHAQPAPNFPNAGLSFAGEDTGATYPFKMLVDAVSGRYRMCWCPLSRATDPTLPVPYKCLFDNGTAIYGDFLVDVGELHIPEVPLAGQTRECISGTHCQIGNFTGSKGLSLPDASQILIKEPDSLVVLQGTRLPTAFDSEVCLDGSALAEEFPETGQSEPATLNGTQFDWGSLEDAIWTSGGTYIMCWKPEEAQTFAYYLGVMIVMGPYSDAGQVFSCTKSADCKLVNVQGVGLGDGDYYRVMSPCAHDSGKEDAADQVTVGIPVTQMEESHVFWSAAEFQGAPRFYSLCWCHRSNQCGHPADFRTTVGDMVIFGPTAGQNKKCDRGKTCEIANVTGINLKAGDELYILVECATGPVVQGFSPPTSSAIATGNDEYFYSWPYVTSIPGIFRICWCAADVCAPKDLILMDDYDVEMGIITIQGPANMFWIDPPPIGLAPLHAHTWNILLTGVNLQVFPDALVRIMLTCPTNVTKGEPVDDVVRIGRPMDRSGANFSFPAQDFQKIIPARKDTVANVWRSRSYNLCWCRGPTVEFPHDNCDDVSKFALHFGVLVVFCPKGREPTDTGCQDCELGRYKSINQNIPCEECPASSLMTTAVTGTVLQKKCYCIPGYYYTYPLSCSPCPTNKYCLGGLRPWSELTMQETEDFQRKDIEPHMLPQWCPANSGAWWPEECTYPEVIRSDLKLLCSGKFPAESALDCSCMEGYESSPKSCTPCRVNYFKPYRGNLTYCYLCTSVYPKSSTLGLQAQTTCFCEAGLYMERDPLGNPIRCVECPIGFYCEDSQRFQCPPGKNTANTGSKSIDFCLCGAGYFENKTLNECLPCPDDSPYYKDSIGNNNCSQACPTFSKVPAGIFGATGPENCLCMEGYIQTLDVVKLEYQCEEDVYGEAKKLRTEVKLTAVVAELDFTYYPGEDGVISVPDPDLVAQDPKVKNLMAAQLGLPNADQIVLEPLPPENIYSRLLLGQRAEVRKLSFQGARQLSDNNDSNGSNASVEIVRTPSAIVVPVKVIIWQSTVVETKSLKDRVETINPSDADSWAQGLSREDPLYVDLEEVAIRMDNGEISTRVEFYIGRCPPNSAVLPGVTYESAEKSCKCIPGYEPRDLITIGELESSDCGVPPEVTDKCLPCCTYQGVGKFKNFVGDDRCRVCPRYAPANEIFPATEPLKGAQEETQCVCDPGNYRPGAIRQCLICPAGHYCFGNTMVNPCPENEWTQEEGQDNITDCKCNVGYFRPTVGIEPMCVGCDPGYYKGTVDDGIGRCTDRCSVLLGTKSTSAPAAVSADECVCQPFTYRKVDIESSSGYKCTTCPVEGVDCFGGKENISNETGWFLQHSEPKAKEGWYMLDVAAALVEECKTQQDGQSVCRGSSVCSEGHEGFLCGNCEPGYTRNKYPDPCRSCTQLAGTAILMLQTAGEFSAQSLWALMLAYFALTKTETKKNVMTVLLRMFGHWSAQIGVLQANYNLTKLKPVQADEEGGAEEEEEEEADTLGIPTENITTTLPSAEEESFVLPPWYEEASAKLNFLAEAFTQVGSQQEVVECMIDRLFAMGGERQRYWRLVGPAAFWLLYPMLLGLWTAILAAIIGFGVIPIVAFATAPKSNTKKKRLKLERKKRKLLLEKRKAEREKEKQEKLQRMGSSISLDDSESHADASLKAATKAAAVQDDFEEDSSQSSDFSDDDDSNLTGAERWKGLFHDPPLLPLVDEMDDNMANPCRFTYEYVDKEDDSDAAEADKQKHVQYIMMLFRAKPVFGWAFILDIMPWIIIVFNNLWPVVTSRMVELLNCERFEWSGSSRPDAPFEAATFLMSHPDTKCMTFETEHGVLAMIAMAGLTLWSLGIISGFYFFIYSHDLQKPFVTRNFGYLLEGYEPQYWYWELIVKKVDLLTTVLITKTSLVTDPRAKILLYSVQASIAFAVQLSTGPYDNRQLRLLDRMETAGLFVREVLFTGIAFSLLFAFDKFLTLALSLTLVCLNGYYLGSLFLHMADDFVTTQVAVATEEKVLFRIANRNKLIKKKRKLKQDETVTEAEIAAAGLFVKEPVLLFMKKVQAYIFFGGGGDTGWRHHQLLRCVWNGPGSDAILYLPNVYDGWWDETPGFLKGACLTFMRMIFGIQDERQQDALSECITSFINTMLSLAEFDQFPGRLTDLIFFLARAVKTLKKNMIKYPDAMRPPHANDPKAEPTKFDDTELLKLALVEELLYSLTAEVRAKRDLLADMREGSLRSALEKEHIPIEAAWDVLDKLTNEQLRTVAMHPIEIYKRIDFNLILSRASERAKASIKETMDNHREEMKVRRRIYRFLDYEMREKIEQDPDLSFHDVHGALNALPLAELNRILNSVDALIDVAEYYQKRGNIIEVFKGDPHNILTVEDLNSMLMFIQKLPYAKLHLVIEWTTMLLDYLVLPAKAAWREDLVARGQREKKDPHYYEEHHRLRQKMREENARDQIVERVIEREAEEEEEEAAEQETKMKIINERERVPCPVVRKSFFEMEEEKKAMQREQFEREHRPRDLSHVRGSTQNIMIDLDHLEDNASAPSMSSFGDNVSDVHAEEPSAAEASVFQTRDAGVGQQMFGGAHGHDSLLDRIDALWRRVRGGFGDDNGEPDAPDPGELDSELSGRSELSGVPHLASAESGSPVKNYWHESERDEEEEEDDFDEASGTVDLDEGDSTIAARPRGSVPTDFK